VTVYSSAGSYGSAPSSTAAPPAVNEPPANDDKIVIMPRRRRPPEDIPPPAAEVPAEKAEKPLAEKPLPGVPASVFRPVRPEDRERAQQPVEPARKPPEPSDDASTLVALGKKAFAAGEYERAERRFRQASVESPADAMPYFLMAQAQFALAKYQEAVASIEAGMRRQPDWPDANFRPRTLYGADPPQFADHLRRLTDTLARFPNDPFLLFLAGYELWFDGQREKARDLFQRARTVTPDKTSLDRFLKVDVN
jgi:tetratricopeptide (TPR) repeat protein